MPKKQSRNQRKIAGAFVSVAIKYDPFTVETDTSGAELIAPHPLIAQSVTSEAIDFPFGETHLDVKRPTSTGAPLPAHPSIGHVYCPYLGLWGSSYLNCAPILNPILASAP
jgi:hypothetical protein